ncbi:unnamed protein product [Knipowitschia caucasica]|uniref:Uncharacterized protein n=1 Tax=Knipowitschia caucasica TaxID=637954 RepID=A0AAV2M3M7_KNICA
MMLQCFVPLCFLYFLSFLSLPGCESRTVILDKCVINVHTHELQKHCSALRPSAIAGDTAIEVRLLDKTLIQKVNEGQTCCFMRLLLRFFVERVFVNFVSEPQLQSKASAVANGLISVRSNIHTCRCQCDEDTQRIMDSIVTEFDKLQINAAAKKAVGELDTVLDWLELYTQKARAKK